MAAFYLVPRGTLTVYVIIYTCEQNNMIDRVWQKVILLGVMIEKNSKNNNKQTGHQTVYLYAHI